MRHAKSSWSDPWLDDHDRPLNPRGERSAAAMGDWLRRKGYLPALAISSTSLRTRQTLDGLQLDAQIQLEPALYHARMDQMLDILRRQSAEPLLLLGHNPGIAMLAAGLLSSPPDHLRFADFPTGATLVLDFDIKDWAEAELGQGRCESFAIPREVMGA